MDCGICCLLSIIRFNGGDVSKEYLRKITNTNNDGVSAFNIIEACKSLGIEAYGLNGNIDDIDLKLLPCIAHINLDRNRQHFVVIYKIDSKKITIMDPSSGKRVLSISEFKLLSSNNYIVLRIKKKLPVFISSKQILRLLLIFIKKYSIQFMFFIFISLNLLLIDILISFNFKYIMSYIINYYNTVNLNLIIIVLLFFIFIYAFLFYFSRKILYKLLMIFDQELTFKTIKQLLLLPYYYFKNRTTGEILSRFNDLTNIKNFIINFVSSFIIDLISFIVFFVILFKINSYFSIFIIIYFVLCLFFSLIRSKRKKKYFKNIKSLEDNVQSYLVESLNNVDTTKNNHLEKLFHDKLLIKYRILLSTNYKYLDFISFESSILIMFRNILFLLVYCYTSTFIIKDTIKIEDMIIYFNFLNYVLNSSSNIIKFTLEIPSYIISYNRIEELFNVSFENFNNSLFYKSYNMDGDIVFSNLKYSIDNKNIFNCVNLRIKRKDKVLLFGSSGSGKSTLMKMLLRYIEVPYSMIKISNIDINHYHLENIRKCISYISSNELLYNDSIYNNICMNNSISDSEFLEIIGMCRLNLFIGNNLDNYYQVIEDNGFLFSGGERQRIILARALVRKSNIYIFDESFSQIDIELTNKIIKDLFIYLKDKTIIVISHRQNSKKYFNRLLKVTDGDIIEK